MVDGAVLRITSGVDTTANGATVNGTTLSAVAATQIAADLAHLLGLGVGQSQSVWQSHHVGQMGDWVTVWPHIHSCRSHVLALLRIVPCAASLVASAQTVDDLSSLLARAPFTQLALSIEATLHAGAMHLQWDVTIDADIQKTYKKTYFIDFTPFFYSVLCWWCSEEHSLARLARTHACPPARAPPVATLIASTRVVSSPTGDTTGLTVYVRTEVVARQPSSASSATLVIVHLTSPFLHLSSAARRNAARESAARKSSTLFDASCTCQSLVPPNLTTACTSRTLPLPR